MFHADIKTDLNDFSLVFVLDLLSGVLNTGQLTSRHCDLATLHPIIQSWRESILQQTIRPSLAVELYLPQDLDPTISGWTGETKVLTHSVTKHQRLLSYYGEDPVSWKQAVGHQHPPAQGEGIQRYSP